MSATRMLKAALAKRTQKWLAASAGLSEQYVSEILRGKALVSHEAARRLGEVLKLSPRKLLVAQLDEQLEGSTLAEPPVPGEEIPHALVPDSLDE